MAKTLSESRYLSAEAVANSLRMQGIDFRGPLRTRAGRILFVAEGCIFLELELVELLGQNKLDREGLQQLAKNIQSSNSRQ
jgi:hypothetical protein